MDINFNWQEDHDIPVGIGEPSMTFAIPAEVWIYGIDISVILAKLLPALSRKKIAVASARK